MAVRSTPMFGIQITLVGNAVTNLLKALQAVDPNIIGTVKELQIQADSSVNGVLWIGDAAISSTRYGFAQSVASNAFIQPSIFGTGGQTNDVPLGYFYLLSTAAMKVNILAFGI